MAWAVYEGDVSTRGIRRKGTLPLKPHGSRAGRSLARKRIGFVAATGAVAARPGTLLTITLVNLGVGIAELDGNVSLQLVFEAHSLQRGVRGRTIGEAYLNARNSLDDSGLAVGYVSNGADIDGGLSTDNFGAQRSELIHIQRSKRLCQRFSHGYNKKSKSEDHQGWA